MIFDCHIHSGCADSDQNAFLATLKESGIDGGAVLSKAPDGSFFSGVSKNLSYASRVNEVLAFTKGCPNLYPFFWIDPIAPDAIEQVHYSVEHGITAFKIICNNFYPSDERAMKVYREIAKENKPILFHSGILWDGSPSSKYNRPLEFEALLNINGLKFALAHVSWPWHDECIALYGKFQAAHHFDKSMSSEMFIDVTPGTPKIYREEVLRKLCTVGYDIENNIMFGTDNSTDNYNSVMAKNWNTFDREIYHHLGVDEHVIQKIFADNFKRFIGV